MCSPCGRRVDSAHGRRPQRAGADGRPETSDRTHHAEHVAHAKQPRREREGHGSDHHQQRKMGDELELLGRMVQGCGAVGGTGEGVRVDDDEATSTRWACGKSVTEPQYPAKSISSSAAHIRFTLFRIDGKFSIIHNTRQSQEPGIPKVHNLNRQSVGYYSTRSETAISSFMRKAFGKVADTRPLRMIASSAVRQLPTETLK